jgi:hypothetical protein
VLQGVNFILRCLSFPIFQLACIYCRFSAHSSGIQGQMFAYYCPKTICNDSCGSCETCIIMSSGFSNPTLRSSSTVCFSSLFMHMDTICPLPSSLSHHRRLFFNHLRVHICIQCVQLMFQATIIVDYLSLISIHTKIQCVHLLFHPTIIVTVCLSSRYMRDKSLGI